jgi:HD-like signal output (HDOD) protein/CheY-like chemotaxis protein
MIDLLLITGNQREAQILVTAFEQVGIRTTLSTPDYANYVKIIQFLPDILLIEMPRIHTQHLRFIRMIRHHKRARRLPIIGFGESTQTAVVRAMANAGVNRYLDRPLKFSLLLEEIKARLAQQQKKFDTAAANGKCDKSADMRTIRDPDTLPVKKIEIMVKHISGLTAFPFTVAKILHLSESEKAGATDLARVIEADPVIAANLLKVANTVFFASANRRIGSIRDAIVRIGFRETKRIVMSMSVMSIFDNTAASLGFNRIEFWRKSVGAAFAAEYLAKQIGSVNTEEAFLAGLLRDFGIMLLDEFFPDLFTEMLEATAAQAARFIDIEQQTLGVTHCDLVKELFEIWKIPPDIAGAASSHRGMRATSDATQTIGDRLLLCADLGAVLTACFSLGSSCDQFVPYVPAQAAAAAKLNHASARATHRHVMKEMRLFRQFLSIDEADAEEPVAGENAPRVLFVNCSDDEFVPVQTFLQASAFTLALARGSDVSAAKACDCVIAWTGATSGIDLEPLSRIPCSGERSDYAPLLVIGESPETHALTLPSALDLRLLEQKLSELTQA